MAEKNVMDKLAARARVRVYKAYPSADDRRALEGEKMQVDEKGQHYFEIAAHRADYINRAFRKYRVTEPFFPGVDDPTTLAVQEKPEPEGEFACDYPGCTKSFKTLQALTAHSRAHK